jgi:hypothetical protein
MLSSQHVEQLVFWRRIYRMTPKVSLVGGMADIVDRLAACIVIHYTAQCNVELRDVSHCL